MNTQAQRYIPSPQGLSDLVQPNFGLEKGHSLTPEDCQGGAALLSQQLLDIRAWANSDTKPQKKSVTANQVLSAILSNRFCREKGDPNQARLRAVERAILAGCPVPVTVLCGPLKNRRLNVPQQPDWAEVFLYSQIARMASAVQEVYSPGIHVEILLDDARAGYANQVPDEVFLEYSARIKGLLSSFGLNESRMRVASQRAIYDKLHVLDFIPQAEDAVGTFLNSEQGRCCWNKIARNSCENNCDGDDCDAAALRYLVAQRAEILAGFWENSQRVMLRYGQSPDFVPRLWTIRKGSMNLPWQGFGALLKLSNGEFRPTVWQPYRACSIKLLGWIEAPALQELLPSSIAVISEADCPSDKTECGGCPNG